MTVQDALGTLTLDATKPDVLALPASSGGPAPATDDLTCWKVKLSKGATPFPKTVQVTTGSAFTSPPKTFALKKPVHLCVATDRDGNGRSTPHPNLLCYQAKPVKGQPKFVPATAVGLVDDFGSHVLDAAADDELCLPPRSRRSNAELPAYLRAKGFRTYVMSAGGVEFMRAMAETSW